MKIRTPIVAPSTVGTKPFLDVAFENGLVQQGELLLIEKVNESKSRAGFCIHTSKCLVHVWKGSPVADCVVEACEEMCAMNPGHQLLIQVDEFAPEGFQLVEDETATGMWVRSKKFGNIVSYSARGIPSAKSGSKNRRA